MTPTRSMNGFPRSRDPVESDCDEAIDLSPERIRFYVARGHELRTEAIRQMLKTSARAVDRVFASRAKSADRAAARANDFLSMVASGLRSPLTSIRSSAEILRDNPDLPDSQRDLLLDIVIKEDERLARLVSEILDASRFEGRRHRWHIRTEKIERQLAPATG